MPDTLPSADQNTSAHRHDTTIFDQERAVAASDAGSECGWATSSKPSASPVRAFDRLCAQGTSLSRLAEYRDEALADPRSFVTAFFDAIESAASDVNHDLASDFEHDCWLARRRVEVES